MIFFKAQGSGCIRLSIEEFGKLVKANPGIKIINLGGK